MVFMYKFVCIGTVIVIVIVIVLCVTIYLGVESVVVFVVVWSGVVCAFLGSYSVAEGSVRPGKVH